jgi:methylated-DNA-[protein]-cysteine S-methyltransferase
MLHQSLPTPFGPLTAIWTPRGLYSCEFARATAADSRGRPPAFEKAQDARQADFDRLDFKQVEPLRQTQLQQTIERYFSCGQLDWDLDWLDWTGVSTFHRVVLQACFQIASGETLTYGALAARAGSPKAARAVGAAMARNRWPILIPCHRVVGSTGSLTGYSGTGGIATKRQLLALEQEHFSFAPTPHLAAH